MSSPPIRGAETGWPGWRQESGGVGSVVAPADVAPSTSAMIEGVAMLNKSDWCGHTSFTRFPNQVCDLRRSEAGSSPRMSSLTPSRRSSRDRKPAARIEPAFGPLKADVCKIRREPANWRKQVGCSVHSRTPGSVCARYIPCIHALQGSTSQDRGSTGSSQCPRRCHKGAAHDVSFHIHVAP